MDWPGLKLLLEGIEPKQVRKRYKNLLPASKMSLFTQQKLYNIGMYSDPHPASEIASAVVGLTAPEMSALLDAKEREIIRLRRKVAWFQRQIFGQKSERRMPEPEGVQGTLGEAFHIVPDDVAAPAKKTRIAAHERAPKNKDRNLIDGNDDAALFFDESKVPVEVIAVANEEAAGLDPADFEVIGEKVSYRLAERPGSYVILKYVRPVIKLRDDQTLVGKWIALREGIPFVDGRHSTASEISIHFPKLICMLLAGTVMCGISTERNGSRWVFLRTSN